MLERHNPLCRPLVVVGKGAAFAKADAALGRFVEASGIPFLATAMGRGVLPDHHRLSANAARSLALVKADVAIIFGARYVRSRTAGFGHELLFLERARGARALAALWSEGLQLL